MTPNDPVTSLSGVGEAYAQKLTNLNIFTIDDLLNHFPSTYLDYSQPTLIKELLPFQDVCLKVNLSPVTTRYKGRLSIQAATASDHSGEIKINWFNQPYLTSSIRPDQQYFLTGKTDSFYGKTSLNSPNVEPIKASSIHSNRIVPIYPLTAGVSSKWLRQKTSLALKLTIPEILPLALITKQDLLSQPSAYQQIHFPDSQVNLKQAQKRLAFNDLLHLYLHSTLTKKSWQDHRTHPLKVNQTLHKKLIDSLPFKLTSDQNQVISQIFQDIGNNHPMNRLVQGDVGSGKTILAIAATLQVITQNKQVVIMAPTQVLADQHMHTFANTLKPFQIAPILVSSSTLSQRKKATLTKQPLLIGTHALLHEKNIINNQTGLVVIDEQHRFGVLQRAHFIKKSTTPHILTMSATPIPRTIALATYGHVDISNIKTLPSGRKIVKTWVIPESKRSSSHDWIKKQVTKGHQVFYVFPFIDPSQHDTLKNVRSATKEFTSLKKTFPKLKLALLHGRLKPAEKESILSDFRNKKYHLLVTTPVIEVGVDIPNANTIVIEGAERFGLAQLHQLRGRVGRGVQQAYCLLFSTPGTTSSPSRLKLLEKYHQGLTLARLDLKIRGAGDMFGTNQSGHLDTQFKFFWNKDLNQLAKQTAHKLVEQNIKLARLILKNLNPKLAKSTSNN